MTETPIILMVFNRPDVTARVFEAVRRARPGRLFVVADGARDDRPGEAALCAQTRAVTEAVDWPCDVTRDYAEANLGCGKRISSGITAALGQVDRAIVLEDDCLPNESFFGFCDAMLERFAGDDRVMAVTGNNFQFGEEATAHSYYFSKYFHCWGWATWARAWAHYDHEVSGWAEAKQTGVMRAWCDEGSELAYWTQIFDRLAAGAFDTWDYRFMLACFLQSGLTVTPRVNLVSNIGFGDGATHTQAADHPLADLPTEALGELRHPPFVVRDVAADRRAYENCFRGKTLRRRYRRRRLLNWRGGA